MRSIFGEAKLVAAKIARDYNPAKIILFGSLARGEKNNHADIDLLIVKKSANRKSLRIKEVYEILRGTKRDFPLDILVYTPSELDWRLSLGDFFITRILKEGKLLYG